MKRLLKNCGIIATGEDGFYSILNGYLGIDGDTIDYIGEEAPTEKYDEIKDMSGKLLIPGLINTHTHTPMCLLRGVGSDLSLQKWLFDTVFPIEDRLTGADCRIGSELAILEMLSTGTTSFTDMYMEPQETINAALKAGIKANICRPVQCFDSSELPEDNFRARQSVELFDKYNGAGDGKIKIDFCIHAEYTCTEDVTRYYSALCNERGGNMHIHLSETKKEHDECVEKYGKTPARWFSDLGAFDSHAFAAHCVWLTDEDMELFMEKNVAVVHNPTSNMKLGSGFAPVQKMLECGITVGLGTDGAASNNNLNMFEEMHLAAVIHNGFTGDPTIMNASTVLKMATASGAAIQQRTDTGELKVGKKADIVALDLNKPHLIPNLDPLALVCYSAQGSDVCMTMVDGKILYENGEFLTLDKERIYSETRAAIKRIYG
jgi:5-methylthioadenosine/S-adenosylhomocysteine deaminase